MSWYECREAAVACRVWTLFGGGHLEVIEQPSFLALELLVLSKYGLHAAELCLGLGVPHLQVSLLR